MATTKNNPSAYRMKRMRKHLDDYTDKVIQKSGGASWRIDPLDNANAIDRLLSVLLKEMGFEEQENK